MRELYQKKKYLEGSLDPSIFDTEADPFVDPNEPMKDLKKSLYNYLIL
jgi:hypothetical protein